MRKDKEEARKLREEGESYKSIERTLKIPRSTLSEWFRDEQWSKNIKEKLKQKNAQENVSRIIKLNNARGEELARLYERAREEARNELAFLKFHPLFISGMMLFWGEGSKTIKSQVRVANTDPKLLRVFVLFLEEIAGIQKDDIRASLLLYPDLKETQCRAYWAEHIGISESNFLKASYIRGRHQTNRLRWGVCTVYVSSTYFRVKMLEWLTLLPNALLEEKYYGNI